MTSCTMTVRWTTIIWMFVLSSVAQETLPYQYRPYAPSQTHEDTNVGQLSRTLKANHVDLHDSSSPPARAIVAISSDQDEINAADRRIVELPYTMNTSVVWGEPEFDSKDSEDFWAWKQLPPSAVPVVYVNPDLFSYGDPVYGEILTANAHGPRSMSAGISHVPSSKSSPSGAAVAQYVFLTGKTEINPENDELEERVAIIPALEGRNTKSDSQNVRFRQNDNRILPYDLHRLPYATDHITHNQRSHNHYSAGKSGIEENNKLESKFEDVSTNKDNDKRKFDSISDISSSGGFGKRQDKRKFDSISDISSFGGFGKRQDKRKFDSIADTSSFGGYGKRQDKRKFDSVSDISSFGGFGKRQDKRKFDSISDISSFGGFGKRQDKRKFDSIADTSSFGGYGKRQDKRKFDSVSDISSFSGFGKRQDKRKFDSISDISSFGGFGKRQDKRKFDSISDISSFGGFGKRQDKRKFDSISDISSFGGFGKRQDKRKFDSIADISSFGGFGKRQDKRKFDSISDITSFGGFGKRPDKRKFDPISEISYFGRLDKRSAPDNMKFDSNFGNGEAEEKRKFDSISGVSSFGKFGKREMGERDNILSTSTVSSFGTVDKSLEERKRKFHSISGFSTFGKFEKRQEQKHRQFGAMPEVGSFPSFNDGRFDPASGLSSLSGPGSRDRQTKSTFDSISLAEPFGEFGKHDRKVKRKFDSISGVSSFGRFNKRENDVITKFKSISGYSSFGNMATKAENKGLYFNPHVRSFEKIEENTVDSNNQMANLDVKGAIMANHYDKSATIANLADKSATTGNLADKSAIMYRNKRDVSDDVEKEVRLKQRNFIQRDDKYNTLYSETNNFDNIDEVNGESNPKSNNMDSEDVDAHITNNYSSMNSLDNALTPDGYQFSPVYSNGPLIFSVRKLDPTGDGSIFVVLGQQRLTREQYKNKRQQYSQRSSNVSKRRFDRISTQGNVFRSFGKRSAANVASKFDELHKRHFDRISDTSHFARFGRDVLNNADYLPPGRLGTNIFDMTWRNVNRSAKRQYNDIFNNDQFTGFSKGYGVNGRFMVKRRFDSIDHNSPFRMFTKKGSDNDNFVMAEFDPEPVVIRSSYSFPEPHKQTPEMLILNSLPHAALHDMQGVFWEPRVDKRHFDSIGHSSTFRRFGRYSNSRWS